ncbi:MAG: NAD(P)H-hydrate dehydratase [Caulobacteraceae bacterium]|nr:NAD(P)H-hydrate dehydratase [Caulobacteraceae bacterium]
MASRHDILTVAEMTAADKATIAAGTPGLTLMRRAGEAVANAVRERLSPRAVVVLCGPGNNGGDGFVAAELLADAGWSVAVALEGDRDKLKGDAAMAAAAWTGPTLKLEPSVIAAADLIVDAVFGAGLSKAVGGTVAETLRAAEASGKPIIAVDLPSGLSGDLARPLGFAPRSAVTVTFHRKKPAHVLEPGRSLCGEVVVADIGLISTPTRLFENGPDLWGARVPWPTTASHKHARGRLIVVSGEMWSTGAARLSARAGLRIGAGLVTVLSPPDALLVNAAHLEAVMLRPFDTDIELETAATHADAAIIGPAAGVSEATVSNLFALARTGAAIVIDADALTAFRDDPDELFSVLDRDDVLTPHPGEFDRVFPGLLAASPERITAVRKAAARAHAVVLLKGSDTVIASPDGRCCVNTNGSPWLATAGSGDVLAGFIGGLVAQGMDSFDAACAAVWIHAHAAGLHGPGLIAEDLPGLAPAVLRELYARRG